MVSFSTFSSVRHVATGLGFTEGPLWTHDGRLLVTSGSRGLLYELGSNGNATPIARTGGSPTGLAQGRDGCIWIAHGPARGPKGTHADVPPGIQVLDTNGELRQIVGAGVDGPNDCAIGPDGRLWFTDPVPPAFEPTGPAGRVCALDPLERTIQVAATGLRFPNGIAFSADGTTLYVAETGTARILRFEVLPDGLSEPRVWCDLGGEHPDGIALDGAGCLYVALPRAGAVAVLHADGEKQSIIRLPQGSFPTNVCFGGVDLSTLYVTGVKGGRVYAIEQSTSEWQLDGVSL
jgi:gluconolactonase